MSRKKNSMQSWSALVAAAILLSCGQSADDIPAPGQAGATGVGGKMAGGAAGFAGAPGNVGVGGAGGTAGATTTAAGGGMASGAGGGTTDGAANDADGSGGAREAGNGDASDTGAGDGNREGGLACGNAICIAGQVCCEDCNTGMRSCSPACAGVACPPKADAAEAGMADATSDPG